MNENDDDDLDDVDQGEELNTQHLVLAQFDKVALSLCTMCIPSYFFFFSPFSKLNLFYIINVKLYRLSDWVGYTHQEQVEMHTEGWHYAHKQ